MPEKDQESKDEGKKLEKESEGMEDDAEPEPKGTDAELRDRILRLAAEFDNYKKRVAKDISISKDMGKAETLSKLLPTLDEFELAIKSFDKKDDHLKGVALVYSNLRNTLSSLGLREIETDGKFDPYRHEIMLAQESEGEDGKIIEVVRKGYMLNSIMLRPASVIVSKHIDAADKEEKTSDKKG